MTAISNKHLQQDAQPSSDAEADASKRAADGNGLDASNAIGDIDNSYREELIAVAAYFIAERRQFQNGSPEDDWLQAEAEIERQLAAANP